MKLKGVAAVFFSPTGNAAKITKTIAKTISQRNNVPLRTVDFTLPQAREKASFCEQRIEALRRSPRAGLQRKTEDGGHDTAVGVVVLVLLVVFFLGALACVGWLLYRLFRGELTQTQVIVTAVVAAVFVLLLIVGKLRAS